MKTAAQKKADQRARWKAEGWAQLTLRVPAGKEDEVRAFVASLGEPSPADLPGQMMMFDDDS
jgi:hypothetical protein